MARLEFEVPLRGEVGGIRPDGMPVAEPGDVIDPFKFVSIVKTLIGKPASRLDGRRLDFDFEAGTAVIELTTDDAAWLSSLEAYLQGKTVGDVQTVMRKTRLVTDGAGTATERKRYEYNENNSEDRGRGRGSI